jgi:hypothetical protein
MEETLMDFNDVAAVNTQQMCGELNNRGTWNLVDS